MSIFHLSLPIKDFDVTRFFYCDLLNGVQEKTTVNWFNVNLKGHQLTFHLLPEEVITRKQERLPSVLKWFLPTRQTT
jgi:extradiol dioxygenase family protein